MKYFVWLNEALGAGNPRFISAIEFFGEPRKIYYASEDERRKSGVFSKHDLLKLKTTSLASALKIITDCEKENVSIIPFGDKRYPTALSVIDTPPIVLFVKGRFPDFNNVPSLAVVGPRKVSEFGKKAALSLSFRLARSGFIIVSGGALGCDTCAHAGALKSGGITVLVMGCGLMADYLKENEKLRNEVVKNGCIISEFSPKTPASKYTFPIRNRIMAALTMGTVVIEAGEKSGALITARHANEQGRDVFVIPGPTDKPEYKGSNALLRDGATAILDLSDIFNEYIPRFPDKINIAKAYDTKIISEKPEKVASKDKKVVIKSKKFNETLSKEAKIVYNCIDKQKFLPEEIKGTSLSSGQLLSALTELEMEFIIKAVPGGMYELCE